jgi:hypothetical protein
MGLNVSENPIAKRVPAEVLQPLSDDQVIYKDGESNEIFLMCLNQSGLRPQPKFLFFYW